MNIKSTIIAATLTATSILTSSLNADEANSNLIKNGDMTKGGIIPVFWDKVRNWGGEVKARRDKTVFKKAPASLRLQPAEGKGKGIVSQLIEGFNGKIKVTGWGLLEAGKQGRAKVAVQLLDKEYKPIQWYQIHNIRTSEWAAFERVITITQSPAHIQILMVIDGEAKAWLDELSVTKQ